MKTTVNFYAFSEAFNIRKDSFSYDGLKALFEYLESYEEDTGEEMELDVIALCCEYSEYDSALEAATEYGYEAEEGEDEDDQEQAALEYLQERTQVIEFSGGVIIQCF